MLNAFGLIFLTVVVGSRAQNTFDCTQPPPFVNPHLCCKDPPPSEVAQQCSEKMGVPLQNKAEILRQPDIGSVTCFAECVMNESKYLNNGKLDMKVISEDIKRKFANDKDKDYIPVMEAAFRGCESVAQRQLAAMQAIPLPPEISKNCNPLSGLILGCAYKEFFENCPASKWNSTAECNTVQNHLKKCSKL